MVGIVSRKSCSLILILLIEFTFDFVIGRLCHFALVSVDSDRVVLFFGRKARPFDFYLLPPFVSFISDVLHSGQGSELKIVVFFQTRFLVTFVLF